MTGFCEEDMVLADHGRRLFYCNGFADVIRSRGDISRYDGYGCIVSYVNYSVLSVREWEMEKRQEIQP